MKWLLIIYAAQGGYSYPIEMPSREICIKAAQEWDDQTVNQWAFCLNKETGELWKSK